MQFLEALNPEQRAAVLHIHGPLLILAGAGSGKTRVITSRIAYLVGDGHAEPHEVLAVTFTNKASEEMRSRVEALLGSDCSRMWISTFHSLSARLLRREAPAIGLTRDFVIYDSSDQLAVVKQALRICTSTTASFSHAPRSRISHARTGWKALRRSLTLPDGTSGKRKSQIYSYYLDMRSSNALDFDDLLLKTVELVNRHQVRDKCARQFQVRHGGRYQDTNRPQCL